MSSNEAAVDASERHGMPTLGFGTWKLTDRQQCVDAVTAALDAGYRHVDTAQVYDNEAAVGEGIARADVPREDVFLATKVWVSNLSPDDVIVSVEESLDRLGTDHVDLLYVHWPAGPYDPAATLGAFADLRDEGPVERIGVSNFEPGHIDRAREVLGEYPFANQVEMHPLLQQQELREYADGRDLELVAYSPLARGKVFDVPELSEIARKYGVSEAQVGLAWLREMGVTPIPKSGRADHVRENWRSLGVELDAEDLALVDSIERTHRCVHPDLAPAAWG